MNEIGTEIEKGAWGCNDYCVEEAQHRPSAPACLNVKFLAGLEF